MSTKLQEKLLLLRLKKKDPDAFARLYDLYVTPLYRFIYFKVPTRQDAEDLTSEVFLKIWQYITETEEEVENLRSLLYRTARNLVVDFYRRRPPAELDVADETLQLPDGRQQNLLSKIDQQTDLEHVEAILRQLKDEYREVVVLRFIEELTITEIAEVLNRTKGSVRVLLHRALKVIKSMSHSE